MNLPTLASLLSEHPNRKLIDSVLFSYQHGFWFGDGSLLDDISEFPLITDNGKPSPAFLSETRKQRIKELAAGRWSLLGYHSSSLP
jgi:hypothetical protein